eukprot:TRINITY_DN5845_c0_g1_i1.p1 TRINITY_DN5845_c0_g1~~TRINITY_DN5845_c0_g1_i1.p1  ORF type:complete len:587 (+),score=93.57 TRINITY_DN5845_c0_g1_i1:92-1762(+)
MDTSLSAVIADKLNMSVTSGLIPDSSEVDNPDSEVRSVLRDIVDMVACDTVDDGEIQPGFTSWHNACGSLRRRWQWLQQRVCELESARETYYETYRRIRRSKQKFVPVFEGTQEQRCCRVAVLKQPKRHRKVIRSGRGSGGEARFVMPNATALAQHPLSFCVMPVDTNVLTPTEELAEMPEPVLISPDSLVSPRMPQPKLLSPSSAGSSRKKHLRTSDYDIDNIVVPFSMFQATKISTLARKDIMTPTFRPFFLDMSAVAEDSDEDMSDETFCKRHLPREMEERKRYLTKPGDRGGTVKSDRINISTQLYVTTDTDRSYAILSPHSHDEYINNFYSDMPSTDATTPSLPSSLQSPMLSSPSVPKHIQIKRKFSAMWEHGDPDFSDQGGSSGEEESEDELVHSDDMREHTDPEEYEEGDEEDVVSHAQSAELPLTPAGPNTRHSATRRPSTMPIGRVGRSGSISPSLSPDERHQHKRKPKKQPKAVKPRVQWIVQQPLETPVLTLPSLDVTVGDEPTLLLDDFAAAADIAATAEAVLEPTAEPERPKLILRLRRIIV